MARLETHPVYGVRVELFLGHAPSTMATCHYAPPSHDSFDEAVIWLGKEFGF